MTGRQLSEMGELTHCAQLAGEALKTLLSEKHLYQNVSLDFSKADEAGQQRHMESARRSAQPGSSHYTRPVEEFQKEARNPLVQMRWDFDILGNQAVSPVLRGMVERKIVVQMPPIRTFCSGACQTREPFNPKSVTNWCGDGEESDQRIFASYQCQGCHAHSVLFCIRRRGAKLTLTGRDPIEHLPAPKVIPKFLANHYTDALLASNCGKPLGGVFHLRVLIEQYWKGLPSVKKAIAGKAKPTGEELGDAYKATLPEDFRRRFPNLLETYNEVSEAIHTATADGDLFEKCRKQIEKHFTGRSVFELEDEKWEAPSNTAPSPKKK